MSKRRADIQIARDQAPDDQDDDRDAIDPARRADPAVLAKRVIAKPRSRLANGVRPGSSAPANPFSSLSGTSAPPQANSSNPFAGLTNFGSQTPSTPTPAASAGFGFSSTNNASSTSSSASNGAPSKEILFRALNESFGDKIKSLSSASASQSWKRVAEAYIKFASDIESGSLSGTGPAPEVTREPAPFSFGASASAPKTTPAETKPFSGFSAQAKPFAFGSITEPAKPVEPTPQPVKPVEAPKPAPSEAMSDSESEVEEIKIQGPTFSLSDLPKTKNAPFSFGDKPKPKDDSDSDSDDDIVIQGPSFTLDKPPTSKNTPFSLPKADSAPPQWSKPAEKSEDTAEEAVSEPAAKPADTPKTAPVFSFGAPAQSPTAVKDHSWSPEKGIRFGAADAQKAAPSNSDDTVADSGSTGAGSFQFSSTSTVTPFKFGATESSASAPKPFSFGASNNGTASDSQPAKPLFGSASDSKPLFGASKDTPDSQPAQPLFGASKDTADSQPAKPLFGASSGESAKPLFGAAPAKPFSFGAPSASPFSFGTPASDNSSENSTPKPFSFGNNSSSFKFGAPAAPAAATEKPAEDGAAAEDGEAMPAEPQTDLSEKGPGEEDETVAYEKLCRVYELVNGEYKVQGKGPLRVLVHNTNKKGRLLIRAEGSGRVLINSLLRSQLKYTSAGKGRMQMLDIKPDGKPTTYIIQVKTEKDAEELTAACEKNKS